ncbi:DUF2085 domain-containing protein [Clostridia bacterium OttesenSCG-928-O13]|nr:DUF2085 domain-containing protein [Clostridia bacterium OttesenSCG-928-O13]
MPLSERDKQKLWLRGMATGAHTGCHQMPDRSLFLGKWQMPVCARCLGIGLGSLAAFAAAGLKKPHVRQSLLLLPLAVDGLTQRYGKRRSNNPLRYVTGWLGGFGYTSALLAAPGAIARALKGKP